MNFERKHFGEAESEPEPAPGQWYLARHLTSLCHPPSNGSHRHHELLALVFGVCAELRDEVPCPALPIMILHHTPRYVYCRNCFPKGAADPGAPHPDHPGFTPFTFTMHMFHPNCFLALVGVSQGPKRHPDGSLLPPSTEPWHGVDGKDMYGRTPLKIAAESAVSNHVQAVIAAGATIPPSGSTEFQELLNSVGQKKTIIKFHSEEEVELTKRILINASQKT